MFVQSVEFIEAHATGNGNGGRARAQISIYGQELNYTTWRLARMNLAIRGIDGRIEQGDTFHNDRFPDLKADFILANPPFNMKEWGGERLREDKRWKFGVPPVRNANFAWVQHIIHHLAPTGYAGFVLANGSMSSNQSGEGEIRKNIIEADLVDCMVALPSQLFYTTQIPACLWFLARDKSGRPPAGHGVGARHSVGARHAVPLRDRRGEVLFIDARKMGRMVDRVHRELTDEEIARIACTYHAWRGGSVVGAGSEPAPTKTFRASVNLPRWRKSASTATSSPLAATWARRYRKTTTNRSPRRCRGWWRSFATSKPRPAGWTRRSGRT